MTPQQWSRTVWTLRILAPIGVATATALLFLSLRSGMPVVAAIDAVLLIINVVLTFVEWCVFTPQWPGRRL